MANNEKPVILVAEDEPDIRQLIKLSLEFSGYQIFEAANGIDAIEIAQKERLDLIILDVRMPRLDGYETCRRLQELESTREIPIIFLSAKGQEEEVLAGISAGAEEYIIKPFAPGTLAQKIEKVLAG